MNELSALRTEQVNPDTTELDTLSPLEIARLMNREDATVARAVEQELPLISRVMEAAAAALRQGGRVFYVGTGSSGRLGVLDAAELPPTFGTDPDRYIGLIAGGDEALRDAQPDLEDRPEAGAALLAGHRVEARDLVIGLTASGRTPFVRGALQHAKEQGARTALVCCNKGAAISPLVEIAVEIEVGPEVLSGSTRLKAGTAQKMALNIISTGAMVLTGHVYKNLMVSLRAGNAKLRDRAVRIIAEAAGVAAPAAEAAYLAAGGDPRAAIVHLLTGMAVGEAHLRLAANQGSIRAALRD